ncbi:MAG TPA: YoaK family protein [Sandaracinaceae bacterium]
MPLSREGKERSFRENVVLAFSLAGVAGAVNGIGFAELGFLTSHVSGTTTRLGIALGTGRWLDAWDALAFVLAFVVGAMTAAILIEVARRIGQPRFQMPLLAEALVLVAFTLFTEVVDEPDATLKYRLAVALSFTMGLQNALVTRLSGAVVRTTHLTGLATDAGIEIVRVVALYLKRTRGESLRDHLRHLSYMTSDPELYRARLHATIFVSFIGGAAAGAWLFARVGAMAMIVPTVGLLALVVYDRVLGVSNEDLEEDYNPRFSASRESEEQGPPERAAAP